MSSIGSRSAPWAGYLVVGGLLFVVASMAGLAAAHTAHPCPCRYAGGEAQPGAIVCLKVDGKQSLAQCEMVLNNPSWRFLNKPCPVASPAAPTGRVG
ncbi:MAG: hypothetical protein FJX35_22900 [Alphaproteobacteria bacterium]|nr:hypothetical protein [Alphaproteobacteria bacterium]